VTQRTRRNRRSSRRPGHRSRGPARSTRRVGPRHGRCDLADGVDRLVDAIVVRGGSSARGRALHRSSRRSAVARRVVRGHRFCWRGRTRARGGASGTRRNARDPGVGAAPRARRLLLCLVGGWGLRGSGNAPLRRALAGALVDGVRGREAPRGSSGRRVERRYSYLGADRSHHDALRSWTEPGQTPRDHLAGLW
jgi:hypothetical protein